MFMILKGETNPRLCIEWHSCLQPWDRQFLLGDVSISRTPQKQDHNYNKKHVTPCQSRPKLQQHIFTYVHSKTTITTKPISGKGTTVLQLVDAFKTASGKPVPYRQWHDNEYHC